MDFSTIFGAAGAVAGGGLFGLIGSVCGYTSKYLQKKQDQKFKLEKFKHEQKLLELNIQANKEETENEIAVINQAGNWKGLENSIIADSTLKPSSKWAKDVKALFRPFLTILLWIFSGWIFYKILWSAQQQVFSIEETKELIKYMVYTVFFSASTATVWWFGDRSLMPPELKK